jgi:GNAT superfamily N-acetyltransferase
VDKVSLAAERIERSALEELYHVAPQSARKSIGWRLETVGSALVSLAEREPDILFNRTLGLGLAEPAKRADVEAVVRLYKDAGVKRYFLHIHPESRPAALTDWLAQHDLIPGRAWMKFRRDAHPAEVRPSPLQIRRVDGQHAEDFARIVTTSFGLTPASIAAVAALSECPNWHLFMAFADGVAAAAGAVYIRDGNAWLDWAATLTDYRGQGGQSALLSHRINYACAQGCRLLITATGEAERAGFQPAYLRANYVPRPADS